MNALNFFHVPSNTSEAVALQKQMAKHVIKENAFGQINYIAGIDTSINQSDNTGCAAAVLLHYPELRLAESQTFQEEIKFPYISGLLSFREIPLALGAFNKLKIKPDLILIDGQGIAHPRRIGFASHFGLIVDLPSIGCAKSRLCGKYDQPENKKGDFSNLIEKGDTIGAVLRTRENRKPLYISTGHKIDLSTSVKWVLACCKGYRLPEPCRLAHLIAKESIR